MGNRVHKRRPEDYDPEKVRQLLREASKEHSRLYEAACNVQAKFVITTITEFPLEMAQDRYNTYCGGILDHVGFEDLPPSSLSYLYALKGDCRRLIDSINHSTAEHVLAIAILIGEGSVLLITDGALSSAIGLLPGHEFIDT